jgi:hypothetical protein
LEAEKSGLEHARNGVRRELAIKEDDNYAMQAENNALRGAVRTALEAAIRLARTLKRDGTIVDGTCIGRRCRGRTRCTSLFQERTLPIQGRAIQNTVHHRGLRARMEECR